MKKYLCYAVAFYLLLLSGCAHYMETSNEGDYTPPSIKSRPRLFYPKIALEKSLSGTPKVLLYISSSGKVDKTFILKSSGFGLLDSAAGYYCKNFVFNPALRNGEPTNSRMSIDVKFTFSDKKWDAKNYVEDVMDLYKQVKTATPNEKNDIEKEILEKHNEYIQNMKDIVNFNSFMKQVIMPDIAAEWDKKWDSWPLSFLLYYDFIRRFPDYNYLTDVQEQFNNSLKSDVQYIKMTPFENTKLENEKRNLLDSIKNFVTKNYPDLLDELELNSKIDTTSIF